MCGPEKCGSAFGRISANLGSQTPLDRRGSSCSFRCSKNQPGIPSLSSCGSGLIHGFGADRKSLIFGVWAALAAPATIPAGGGGDSPPFLERLLGPPVQPRPHTLAIAGRPKNHVLKGTVLLSLVCVMGVVWVGPRLPGLRQNRVTSTHRECSGPLMCACAVALP